MDPGLMLSRAPIEFDENRSNFLHLHLPNVRFIHDTSNQVSLMSLSGSAMEKFGVAALFKPKHPQSLAP